MSDSRRPLFRLKFRTKDGQKYDIGTVWPGRFQDSHDVKFETETTDGQYPKMNAEEAIRRAGVLRDGFISLVSTEPRQQRDDSRRNAQPTRGFGSPPPSDFDEGDIPF